jgi:hypothetical protein
LVTWPKLKSSTYGKGGIFRSFVLKERKVTGLEKKKKHFLFFASENFLLGSTG